MDISLQKSRRDDGQKRVFWRISCFTVFCVFFFKLSSTIRCLKKHEGDQIRFINIHTHEDLLQKKCLAVNNS